MNLGEYVQELPQAKREQLYKSPWVCQALLRSLPPLAQQYIFNMLFLAKGINAEKEASRWMVATAKKQHNEALELLKKINLLRSTLDLSGQEEMELHPSFKQQLSWGVRGGGQVVEAAPEDAAAQVPAQELLDQYAQERWEAMQMFLLTGDSSLGPSMPSWLRAVPLDLKGLLIAAGLMVKVGKQQEVVSDLGFRFLLRDTHGQLWALLRQYIRRVETGGEVEEWAALMNFLMALGFRRVGQAYAWADLGSLEARAAAHLVQLGLLYAFMVEGAVYFCPTRLAASLCGGYSGDSGSSRSLDGYIIVETNYRVYAYTSSHIQISILQLFCRTDALLPNLFVGMITRESVARALDAGISADMVNGYLDQHAHPNIANKVPRVPAVVSDQIRLWERQTQRVVTSEAVLYDNFELPELHDRCLAHAAKVGALLWKDPHAPRFIGCVAKHPVMRDFIIRAKAELLPAGAPGGQRTRAALH